MWDFRLLNILVRGNEGGNDVKCTLTKLSRDEWSCYQKKMFAQLSYGGRVYRHSRYTSWWIRRLIEKKLENEKNDSILDNTSVTNYNCVRTCIRRLNTSILTIFSYILPYSRRTFNIQLPSGIYEYEERQFFF